jgi:NTE family protein
MREMRMFVEATDFAGLPFFALGRFERWLQKMRFHMIDSSHLASLQRTDTKLLAHGPFLDLLRGQGRECAAAWLSNHADGIGRRSTVDVKKWFA